MIPCPTRHRYVPHSDKSSAILGCPCAIAACSGVRPLAFRTSTSGFCVHGSRVDTRPALNHTSSIPLSDAKCNGVTATLVRRRLRHSRGTIAQCQRVCCSTPLCSGLRPSLSRAFTSTPQRRSDIATSMSPNSDAAIHEVP